MQGEVLARLIQEPDLLRESFGDLTVDDFGGQVYQSLFSTIVKLVEEGTSFDTSTVADAWGAEKLVANPAGFIGELFEIPGLYYPSANLRLRVDKLHRLATLRRLHFVGQAVQRQTVSPQADPYALIEKLEVGLQDLRSGVGLNGELVAYTPRNLARRPDVVPLSSFEAKPVPWLWQPYLSYGMVSLLSGEPGCGKTFLALAFAAALTVGKIPGMSGEPCQPHDVLYLSIENDPQYVVKPRFDSLEGDANRFHVLQGALTGEGPRARREGVRLSDIPLLESAVKQTRARFLVVDPIQSYLGDKVDMHRSNETRPVMDGLVALARKYGTCLLILRHFAKSTAGSAINRGLGSIDLTGAARTELHAGERDGQSVMAHAKSNIGEFGKSIGFEIRAGVFRWTGETSISANDLAASGGMTEEDRDAASEAMECLCDLLRGGPKLQGEIFDELKKMGISTGAVRRAKKKLDVQHRKRTGTTHGQWEWYLEGCEDGEITPS
jgi:hypothetical protein